MFLVTESECLSELILGKPLSVNRGIMDGDGEGMGRQSCLGGDTGTDFQPHLPLEIGTMSMVGAFIILPLRLSSPSSSLASPSFTVIVGRNYHYRHHCPSLPLSLEEGDLSWSPRLFPRPRLPPSGRGR